MTGREFPAEVLGNVDKEHDFEATLAAAVEMGLEKNENRQFPRWRIFTGRVATEAAFNEVSAVEGIINLEYSGPVFAAEA